MTVDLKELRRLANTEMASDSSDLHGDAKDLLELLDRLEAAERRLERARIHWRIVCGGETFGGAMHRILNGDEP